MKKLGKKILAASVIAVVGFAPVANAGVFTAKTNVVSVRSYVDGSYFVTVATAAMKSGPNCTTVYKVVPGLAGQKTIIATILTAKASGSQVELETTCSGWGSPITSVVVY